MWHHKDILALDWGRQRERCPPWRSTVWHCPQTSPLPTVVAVAPGPVGEVGKAGVLGTCFHTLPVGGPTL